MWDLVWTVVPFAISMTASPGPNNVMVTASATNFGFRRTLPQILGFALGLWVMILLVGIGFGRVLEAFPILHEGLKYAGAAYLLYLAWRIATSSAPGEVAGKERPLSFLEAALFQWLNPKAWVVTLGAVTTYTNPARDLLAQALIISAVFGVICLPSVSAWALFGEAAARLLKTPASLRLFNYTMAGLLVLSIVTIFI